MQHFLLRALLAATATAALAGCGKNDAGRTNRLLGSSIQRYEQAVTLSGTVSNESGPLPSGNVAAVTVGGAAIADAALQNGRFTLRIPAGTQLPFLLKATGSDPQTGSAALEAVAVDAAVKNYQLNPLSTAITAKARSMGGFSREIVTEAAMTSVSVPDANKTTGGFRGDPTKQYGGWH